MKQNEKNNTQQNKIPFLVKRTLALDSFGNPIVSDMGKQIYNYQIFGKLFGKEVCVQLDVVVKQLRDGKSESKAAAYELLDLAFDDNGQTDNIVLRPVESIFTGADGKPVKRTSYALFAIEPDTGYEVELPIKPRTTTDNTKLVNLIRKDEYLSRLPKDSDGNAV